MRTEVAVLIVSLIFVDVYRFCYASHFRGGYITWRPVDNTSQIEIIYRISWRRSAGHYCDSDTIVNDELNPGEGSLTCRTCHLLETIGQMTYKCTDFSQIEDWTTGTHSFLFDYGNNTEFYIGYSNGNWITLQYGGGDWSVMTFVKTSTRNDTQKRNTSPITSMQPLTRLSLHCDYKIRIPVNDIDGDTVRCRWARSSFYPVDECADVCNALPGSYLIEETCELNYTANTAGYFAVALQIEDFISPVSDTPLSSVPLQFLILVSNDSNTCAGSPTFSNDTVMDRTTLYITSGELFSLQIVAASSSSSTSIREIITVSPVNMTKTPLLELGNMTEMWSINVSWTPTAVQAGDHIFCFSAIDGNGLSSEQRCITLIVDGKQPEMMTTEVTTATTLSAATSTTIGSTPSSTTSLPTLPPVCLNNRTRTSNLMDLCGFHSANVICDVDNATCMTSMDDTWRCRCMKGFYQTGQKCEKVPDSIFRNGESEINAEVTIDSNIYIFVYYIDITVNSSSTSCSVSNPDLFFCFIYGLYVGIYIRNPIALTVIADSFKVNVFVSTSVDSSVLSGQINIIVKVTQPVLTFSVLVGDSTVPGQIIIHLPVTTNISLSLNDTRFELNDNYNIILVRDVKEVSDSSTVVFMIPIEVTENRSRRRAIVLVHVLRTRFEKEVPENVVAIVAYIENSQLYNITLKGDDSHLFTTMGDTVRMVNALDYDGITGKELHFKVEIGVDDGMSADCEVYIKLLDEDDVSPKFSERTVTVRIIQSALMTFVMNLEAEDIDTRNLSYSLRPETSEFVIKNGFELWKKSALTGSNVTVVASDLVNVEDTMNVFVEVESPISQDLNLTFRANIDEEEPIGTHVLTIKADSHENFQFFDATSSAYFHLDNSTGNVTLARKIDRDTDKYLQRNDDILVFYIRATEKGTTCSFVNLGKIEVKIRDINDIVPSFTHAQYTGTVEEERSNQTLKIKPAIGISDGDKTNTFTFSLINYADTFGIRKISDTNIEIFTKREIDRDDGVSSTFTLHVQVFDGLNMNSTILTVSVLDINDNSPIYMNITKSFSLKENSELSTPIAFLYYTDSDDGSNSELVYGDDTGYFSVNDGILSVDGPIDRETISQHNLSLTVCDRGNDHLCSVDKFIIYVEDVNDNSPTFVSPLGVTTVAENHSCSVGNVITKVSFDDADINENGRLTYRIKSMANIFNISETTGDVYCIEELDFETITDTLYVMEIEACDNGIERKCSQTDVYIGVTDVNDNSPVFLGEFVSREYMTSVEASDFSSASSKPIALVSATDYDSGRNGELTYNIESGNGTTYVEIDSITGLLKSKVQTNPTQGLTYSVLISVRDKGQSPLTNQTYVHFTIKQTSASFEFTQTDIVIRSVTEEILETAILNLTQYIRNDNGVTLKYSIPSSQDLSFVVNEDSGMIDLTKKLDREVKDKHLFPVRASNDDASALALVTVIVLDVNDNIPIIPADLRRIVALPENTPTGTMFLNVTATDADIGNNALTRFTLDAENGSPEYCASSFRINETIGVVTLEEEVDFDVLQQRKTNTYCRFLIKAIDMGNSLFSSTASLTVEVRDVNDNVPRFVGTSYTLQIPEGATAAEKFVWGVYVTDADMKNSANGDVIVAIKNPGLCPFDITMKKIKDNDRSVTFFPRDNTDLDFETNEKYDCELLARDNGSPTLESNVSMVITLTDVNDNAPMVLDGPYVLNMSRYVEPIHVILQRINAKDMDVGENARLTFRKADEDSDNVFWDYFSISSFDGKIMVYKRLNSLDVDEIVLKVNISDNGSPVLYTVYSITIQLEDDNQRPYFGRLPVSVNVSLVEETRYLGQQSIFGNIPGFPRTALDDQKSGTAACDCDYYLQYHHEIFEVDQMTADIYIKENKSIDREINSSVILQLIGRDNGLPPQQTIPPLIVYINIYDVNDNPPVFTQSNYQAVIFQDYPLYSDVFTVRAVDRDEGDNAVTQYTIISVTPAPDVAGNFNQSAFSIHSNNGTIFLHSSVYLNTTDTYFFVITAGAYDVNKPTYTDTARVTVTVEYNDPNLHPPVFSQDSYLHELMLSDTSPGDYILTVTATDRDTDSKLEYSITEGNVRDTFGISRDSGNITLKYPIDQRVFDRLQDPNSKNFKLTVIALDNGVIPKTGTTTVTITLKDNPQPCNLGLRQQQTTTTSAPVPDDPGFQIAMFVLIGVVSALLISNTVFILKYCRGRSVPVTKKETYAGYDSKRLTKQHDYDGFQNNREQHGQYPGNNQDWTANPAYGDHNVSREAHVNRGFHDDGRNGPPPSLPPRPELDPRFHY